MKKFVLVFVFAMLTLIPRAGRGHPLLSDEEAQEQAGVLEHPGGSERAFYRGALQCLQRGRTFASCEEENLDLVEAHFRATGWHGYRFRAIIVSIYPPPNGRPPNLEGLTPEIQVDAWRISWRCGLRWQELFYEMRREETEEFAKEGALLCETSDPQAFNQDVMEFFHKLYRRDDQPVYSELELQVATRAFASQIKELVPLYWDWNRRPNRRNLRRFGEVARAACSD